ncbi:MAG: ABC transporter substrate-binding protein [Methylobacter sp.]|uniref:ABC transporter substrate-binding protein n=1 Tax=Methylobacter sp. TaxID=2051955 RepID=UPI0025ED24D2|nr:ABC transporter substrate-binding protein [Methylobacter sp.]MCK9622991.1 ABC transporter substrate-binding protein [Methylobacter sp.]
MIQARAILIMALIFLCFSVSAEPIHLQLRWHHQFQFAGYYAALEKGYYKDAGLDVTIHEGTSKKKPVQEVLQGHAQYGEANSELLLERLRGAPLVALAAIYQHSPSVLIARKSAGIHSPDDLVGKKIMLMDQTVDADFVAMFNNEGIDKNRLHIIPSSYEIRDLVDGKVDAFNSYLSNEPYFLKQRGVEFTVLNPRNYGVDFYSDILFTTEEELKQHPERVKAFRKASLEGWYYAMNHPQEIIDLLIDKYKVNKSRDHLEFEADAINSLIIPDVIDLGHMNPWRWRHMAETFVNAGMAENDKLLQGFSYDPDPKADQEKLIQYVKIGVIVILITSFITLILLASYRSLKRKNKIALRNEKLLRLAHETAGMGYYVIDLVTGHWEGSPLLDKIFGVDAHFERNISSWATLVHPEHRQRVLDRYQEIIRNHERLLLEYEIIRPNDTDTRWVIAHGYIEFDKAGNPLKLVGTIQDITERKQTEEIIVCLNKKLKKKVHRQTNELIASNVSLMRKVEELDRSRHQLIEREAKLNSIFNASVEGIITINVSNIIVSANAAVETIFGYKPEELVNSSISKLIPLPARAMNDSAFPNALKTLNQIQEIDGLHKNGSLVPLDISTAKYSIDNEHFFTHIVRDVSMRKYQEQKETKHLKELAHVTRLGLMGEMASGIAHEVNQPLSAISSYTQVSLNLINAELPDLIKLAEILHKTQDQALRAGRIIHRMREFVKSHAQKCSSADINKLVHDSVGLCMAELKQNDIKLTFELDNNLPPVHVDQIQIEQVIINLIRNSVDAVKSLAEKQQRQLTISSRMTFNNSIQIRVKDNGVGIDKEQQQKILTPFYTTKADGMGMGLSITRSLVEAHDGTLNFNSQPGKGTTFYFTLPIQRNSDSHQ